MGRFLKIFLVVVFAVFVGYGPEATENSTHPVRKLTPGNIRLLNEMSDDPSFGNFEKTIKYFLRRWDIVGASVAVAKDGMLVYAKGFGYADSTTLEPVQPYNRFRIASISKLITAVAVMKLQEEGKLSVNDLSLIHI